VPSLPCRLHRRSGVTEGQELGLRCEFLSINLPSAKRELKGCSANKHRLPTPPTLQPHRNRTAPLCDFYSSCLQARYISCLCVLYSIGKKPNVHRCRSESPGRQHVKLPTEQDKAAPTPLSLLQPLSPTHLRRQHPLPRRPNRLLRRNARPHPLLLRRSRLRHRWPRLVDLRGKRYWRTSQFLPHRHSHLRHWLEEGGTRHLQLCRAQSEWMIPKTWVCPAMLLKSTQTSTWPSQPDQTVNLGFLEQEVQPQ
jgi:hypothetical protein